MNKIQRSNSWASAVLNIKRNKRQYCIHQQCERSPLIYNIYVGQFFIFIFPLQLTAAVWAFSQFDNFLNLLFCFVTAFFLFKTIAAIFFCLSIIQDLNLLENVFLLSPFLQCFHFYFFCCSFANQLLQEQTAKLRSGVNFINVLRERFSYESSFKAKT